MTKDFNSFQSFSLDHIESLKKVYVLLKCLRTGWAKATVTLKTANTGAAGRMDSKNSFLS